MQEQIEKLNQIINDPSTTNELKAIARNKLQRLQGTTSSQPSLDDIFMRLNTIIEGDSAVNEDEVKRIVSEELDNISINYDMLDSSLKAIISRGGAGGGTMTIQSYIGGNVVSTSAGKVRKLFEVLLSDVESGNNSYLYGGAGTGKTFIAKQLAKALNYKIIVVNCNQFTSPLELIGGQTIEGYQEGKLTRAWGNLDLGMNNQGEPYSGALLLLDELPKIDPNTAGVLNDSLSTIKDPKTRNPKTGAMMSPMIQNGRGEDIEMKNIYIMATGNSLLNEADKDYEANYKQDLSLQDRFAGCMYKVYIDYDFELNQIMRNIEVEGKIMNLTFLWNYLIQLREAIVQLNFTNRGFVSSRLMINLRDNYIAFRLNMQKGANGIKNPKTLQLGITSFLDIFTEQQRVEILNIAGSTANFFAIVDAKNNMPIDQLEDSNDTLLAETLIEAYRTRIGDVL